MTYLLCKLFIKNRDDVRSPSVIRAYGTLSSVVGIILNVMLAAIKLLAGVLSASISITADAINNLSDVGSQAISFISFKMSSKPADKDHPFGHARMEYIASKGFKTAGEPSSVEEILLPEEFDEILSEYNETYDKIEKTISFDFASDDIKDGTYYFMWTEGGWTQDDYRVAYAISDNPLGPFERIATILEQDLQVGTGAGHHSIIQDPKSDKWYIIYHRHPLGSTEGNDREVCIDELHFDENGYILPVKMTFEGVEKNRL